MAPKRPAKLRVAHTWEEVDGLKVGQTVRFGPELKLRSAVEREGGGGRGLAGMAETLPVPGAGRSSSTFQIKRRSRNG